MIYELRVYKCVPGRLPALLNRFANTTLKIWEKHGIKQAGFWTTVVGESSQELYYLLAWESLADREKKWNAFVVDPEWLAKRAELGEFAGDVGRTDGGVDGGVQALDQGRRSAGRQEDAVGDCRFVTRQARL